MQWTQEKKARFIELWETGISAEQIGRELGCTYDAIWRQRIRLGLATRATADNSYRWPAEKDEKLRKLWASGTMVKIICAELKVGKNSLQRRRAVLGLPKRQHGRTYYQAVRLHADEEAAMRSGAHRMGTSNAKYLRHLIRTGAAS